MSNDCEPGCVCLLYVCVCVCASDGIQDASWPGKPAAVAVVI